MIRAVCRQLPVFLRRNHSRLLTTTTTEQEYEPRCRAVILAGLPRTGYSISSVLDQVIIPNSSGGLFRVHPFVQSRETALEVVWIDWAAAQRFMAQPNVPRGLTYTDETGKQYSLTTTLSRGRPVSAIIIANIGLNGITRILRVEGFPSVQALRDLKERIDDGRYYRDCTKIGGLKIEWSSHPIDRTIADEENLALDIHSTSIGEADTLRKILERYVEYEALHSTLRFSFIPDPCSNGSTGLSYDDDPNYGRDYVGPGPYRVLIPIDGEAFITVNRRLLVLGNWRYLTQLPEGRNYTVHISLVRGILGLTFSHKEAAMEYFVIQAKQDLPFKLVWGNPVHPRGSVVLASHLGASTCVVFRGIECPHPYPSYFNKHTSQLIQSALSQFGSVWSVLSDKRIKVNMKSIHSAFKLVANSEKTLTLSIWQKLRRLHRLKLRKTTSVGFYWLGRSAAHTAQVTDSEASYYKGFAKQTDENRGRPKLGRGASKPLVGRKFGMPQSVSYGFPAE